MPTPSVEDEVYFISGGNRGIGYAIVKQLSEQPNITVITTAREPEKADELQGWIKKHPNVYVIKYDALKDKDAQVVAQEIEKITSNGIDVFIANAGIEEAHFPAIKETADIWRKHYDINVLAPILLTQALYPLLLKRQTRKILYTSTALASKTDFWEFSASAYGQSKAALNYTAKELSFEHRDENFIIVPFHPGLVASDMGNAWVKRATEKDASVQDQVSSILITVDESAAAIIKLAENLTKADNGKFLNYDGTQLTW